MTDLEEVAVHALGEKDGYLVNHRVILVLLAEIYENNLQIFFYILQIHPPRLRMQWTIVYFFIQDGRTWFYISIS